MDSPRLTGFEFEASLRMLPIFLRQATDAQSHDPLASLLKNPAQGESGPAWNTLLFFVLVTAALKQQGLKAGIYQGAFDELVTLLGNEDPDVRSVSINLQAAGFLIPGYQQDTFGIGFDCSTVALPPRNARYFSEHPQLNNPFPFNQFSGFEVNGPVYANPFAMADGFARMITALQPLGLLTPGSCGIHQHIDIHDFTYRDLVNLMRIQAFCGDALRQTVFPPHRRDSLFCRPLHYHISPLGNIPPLALLSKRLESLGREYDEYSAKGGADRITLLKSMARDIQANIFPSGKINQTFYAITNSILGGTLREDIEGHLLNLRRQRYFDPSPESPYTKLTLEKRWMPSTDNPAFARAWFILNYASVDLVTACADSHITYDSASGNYTLSVKDKAGRTETYGQSFDEVMRYLSIPDDVVPHDLLREAAQPSHWGDDPLQDDLTDQNGNMGLWPQAPVPPASLHGDHLEQQRGEIYDLALNSLRGQTPPANCNEVLQILAASRLTAPCVARS